MATIAWLMCRIQSNQTFFSPPVKKRPRKCKHISVRNQRRVSNLPITGIGRIYTESVDDTDTAWWCIARVPSMNNNTHRRWSQARMMDFLHLTSQTAVAKTAAVWACYDNKHQKKRHSPATRFEQWRFFISISFKALWIRPVHGPSQDSSNH